MYGPGMMWMWFLAGFHYVLDSKLICFILQFVTAVITSSSIQILEALTQVLLLYVYLVGIFGCFSACGHGYIIGGRDPH